MVVQFVIHKTRLLQKCEVVFEAADVTDSPLVSAEDHPDDIYALVKDAVCELDVFEPMKGVDITFSHELGPTDTGIGQLVIEAGDCNILHVVGRPLELTLVNVLPYLDCTEDGRLIVGRYTQGVYFHLNEGQQISGHVLEREVVGVFQESVNVSRESVYNMNLEFKKRALELFDSGTDMKIPIQSRSNGCMFKDRLQGHRIRIVNGERVQGGEGARLDFGGCVCLLLDKTGCLHVDVVPTQCVWLSRGVGGKIDARGSQVTNALDNGVEGERQRTLGECVNCLALATSHSLKEEKDCLEAEAVTRPPIGKLTDDDRAELPSWSVNVGTRKTALTPSAFLILFLSSTMSLWHVLRRRSNSMGAFVLAVDTRDS
jgi:hypothetical protein